MSCVALVRSFRRLVQGVPGILLVAVAFAVLRALGYHRELEPVLYEFLRPLGEQAGEVTARVMSSWKRANRAILRCAAIGACPIRRTLRSS